LIFFPYIDQEEKNGGFVAKKIQKMSIFFKSGVTRADGIFGTAWPFNIKYPLASSEKWAILRG